tara:strand:+ start:2859 stop:3332 length:474 start_codon:yes stop_codon:yes gene_type:complete
MACPSKLTPKTRAKICAAIRKGATREIAAASGGVGVSTINDWLRHAARPDSAPKFSAFSAAVKLAEADNALRALAVIEAAAIDGSWQAAAWVLERRHGYRRDAQITLAAATDAPADPDTVVDPRKPEGRAVIIDSVSRLPEEMILAALNLKNASSAK